MSPTIILVHGAYAESSSWNDVAERLLGEDQHVIAYANPLRSIAGDAAGLTELVRATDGPVILVGHSYGGAVISAVPADAGDIAALVYVAGFALEAMRAPPRPPSSCRAARWARRSRGCRCPAGVSTPTSRWTSSTASSAPTSPSARPV